MGLYFTKLRKSKFTSSFLLISLLFLLFAVTGCSSSSEQPTAPSENLQTQSETNNNSVETSKPSTVEPTKKITGSGTDIPQISGKLTVHFLDVGQADSILVQLPNNQTMLIDAGNNDDANFVVSYLEKLGVKKVDYLVGTHPHEDHIGGLDAVIKCFDIGKVIMPKKTNHTDTFKDVLVAIKDKGLKITKAEAGQVLLNEKDLNIAMIAPGSSSYDDLNNYSAVIKVTFGKISFLFEGDAEEFSEFEMLASSHSLKADVLKVGHHGSSSSTSTQFLKAVDPRYAVISVGAGNDYGHPHHETLDKLKNAGVKIYRTDKDGTLIFKSDGTKITVTKSDQGHPANSPS